MEAYKKKKDVEKRLVHEKNLGGAGLELILERGGGDVLSKGCRVISIKGSIFSQSSSDICM